MWLNIATASAALITALAVFFVDGGIGIKLCIFTLSICFISQLFIFLLFRNNVVDNINSDSKTKEDITTLYQNQKMLISLINAVRIRINNFYAKKLKNPKLKSTGFDDDITGEPGETEESNII
jgi:hypothetical protein